MSDDDLIPYDLTGRPGYFVWPAGLPHDPIWNLIPRRRPQPVPWECSWHGTINAERCEECHREHAEYLETGTFTLASEDRAPDPLAALGDSVALGFGDGIASAIRSAFGGQE